MKVLFDLDGTLTDSHEGITRCIRHGMASVGRPLEPSADLRWCIGPELMHSFETMLGEREKGLATEALKHYRERYAEAGMFENKVYLGVVEMLEQLRSGGQRLFVATSKTTMFAEKIVAHFGLRAYFERVHGSELDGTRGAKTELIRYVLERERIAPAEAVMVGDREQDIIGAKANGLRSVGVLWGYGSRDELEAAGADALASAVAQLPAVLSR